MKQRLDGLGFVPSLLFAATSGFIIALGAPPNGWHFTYGFGFVPLVLLATRESTSIRDAGWFGFVGGLGIGLGGFPWISEMLVQFARLPEPLAWIGLFGFSSWMAIAYAIWTVLLRVGPAEGVPGWLWTASTFAAVQFSWPVLFPYTPFLGMAEVPALMQLAELIGVHGLEAVAISATFFLSRAIVADVPSARLANVTGWIAVPVALFAWGSLRMADLDEQAQGARSLRIGIVQPNVGIGGAGFDRMLERLRDPSQEAERQGAELIVWPEAGAFPIQMPRPFPGDSRSSRRRVLDKHKTPTIFGAGSKDAGARFGYNSAYFIDAEGRPLGSYDKVNLVPLGEAIPLIDPDWVTDRIPEIAHHEAGLEPARFVLPRSKALGGDVAMAPLICYEDIIPAFVRESARQPGGVELLVNLTIDSWYGDSAEPWEHLALAQFRAVEHRVPIVRSVSTGVSAVVDYNGRLLARIPLRPVTRATLDEYPPEILVEDLVLLRNTESDPTVFAAVGWLFPYACCLGVAVGAFAIWRRSA